jgi:predicted negative regulator of RcsB-dependent stress response
MTQGTKINPDHYHNVTHLKENIMKKSNALLVMIFVALLALFGFLVYEESQETPLENASESISESVSDITDN